MGKNILRIVLLCVFFAAASVNAVVLTITVILNLRGDGELPQMEQMEQTEPAEEIQAEAGLASLEYTEPEPEPEIEIEPEPEYEYEVENIRTPLKPKRVYQEKFDSLRARYNNNEDIIGILKIPETVIFYPVAQHADNDFYLERNYLKQISSDGAVFLDFENSVERRDPSMVLFAHNMNSDVMFSHIKYFADEEFFFNNRHVIFNTVYENSVWETFAFFESHVSFNYIRVLFRSELDFLRLAREISSRSLYDAGIEITAGDRILILSTCTNADPDTRYVLVSRMIKNQDDIPDHILAQMHGAVDDYLNPLSAP